MTAAGIMADETADLGLEASGVVQALGSGSDKFKVGDEVIFLSHGCMVTDKVMPETLCLKKPINLSFGQAASIPCVFATAILSLVEKAGLRRGQVRRWSSSNFHLTSGSKLICSNVRQF